MYFVACHFDDLAPAGGRLEVLPIILVKRETCKTNLVAEKPNPPANLVAGAPLRGSAVGEVEETKRIPSQDGYGDHPLGPSAPCPESLVPPGCGAAVPPVVRG